MNHEAIDKEPKLYTGAQNTTRLLLPNDILLSINFIVRSFPWKMNRFISIAFAFSLFLVSVESFATRNYDSRSTTGMAETSSSRVQSKKDPIVVPRENLAFRLGQSMSDDTEPGDEAALITGILRRKIYLQII